MKTIISCFYLFTFAHWSNATSDIPIKIQTNLKTVLNYLFYFYENKTLKQLTTVGIKINI